MNVALWIVQVLLAGLFVFAGGFKLLMMPIAELTKQTGFSAWFIRFISVAELLGGLGLVLPGLLRIAPGLTPLAALGLTIIMIGAAVVSLPMGIGAALMPFVVGLLLVFVAVGRWRLAPSDFRVHVPARGRSHRRDVEHDGPA
ncbi:MAG TPA: DoxX family protein [Methylomirabilota bacterium]|nr:DoxX family protein [Methylomirabilota bacterium]